MLNDQLTESVATSEDAKWFKAKLVDLVFEYRQISSHQSSLLNSLHIKETKKLKRNKELVIIQSDKGSGIVVINHLDCVGTLNGILEDSSNFELDFKQKDGVILIETFINGKLKELKKL